ncbi:MAG: VPGUxxT family thioredoxin-like (seleno)protein, type 2 [Phycisphaerae bacterium]
MNLRDTIGTRRISPAATAIMLLMTAATHAEPPDKPARPPELGAIAWARGFSDAAQKARHANKPLLVLFQEVPGCNTCKTYGDAVLSHPLIRDAAESLFVPLAVFNNIRGPDARTLKSFGEKPWNNPVVRIITHDRKALADRVAGDYTVAGLASAMVAALKRHGDPVPTYLSLLAEETAARKHGLARATFAMHCFWEGEGALGDVDGVIATMPGFLQGKEVVEVRFDPRAVSYAALVAKARTLKCADTVFVHDPTQQKAAEAALGSAAVRTDAAIRPDKQPKYYLAQTPYRYVPMTGLQASRVNAALGRKQDPKRFLSPGQVALHRLIERNPKAPWPDAIGADDLPRAWRAAEQVARSLRPDAATDRRPN